MQYTEDRPYPFPASQLLRAFTDPAFFVAKYTKQGATNIRQLDHADDGADFSIAFSRDVAVEADIPAFARNLVPNHMTLVQTDRWNMASRTGLLTVDFKGLPVKVECRMEILDTPDGCLHRLHFDIQVSVPLVGKKLEKLLAEDLQMKSRKDLETSRGLIEGYAEA